MAKEKLREISLDEVDDTLMVPIGDVGLDAALGGGIPTNSVVEIYGNEASGKTTLCFEAAKAFLRQFTDKYVYYYSYERSVDKFYVRTLLGNDAELLKRFKLVEPTYLEDGMEHLLECMESDLGSLYIIDSLAAMTPKAENDKDLEKVQVGGYKAKAMAEVCRKIGVQLAENSKATVIFINHVNPVLGSFIPQTITPGGKAVKFWASLRMEIGVVDRVYREEVTPGIKKADKIPYINLCRVKVEKNKYYPPYKRALVAIRLGQGIDKAYSLIEYGQLCGLIGTKGSGIYYLVGKEADCVKGKEAFALKINKSDALFNYLHSAIAKFIEQKRLEAKNPNIDAISKSFAVSPSSVTEETSEDEVNTMFDDYQVNASDQGDNEADIDDL